MEKIDIILWILGGGFGLMLVMWNNLHSQIDKLESRMNKTDETLQQMNTKVAVMESRLNDISNNISYLMWHNNQAIPQKEADEQ